MRMARGWRVEGGNEEELSGQSRETGLKTAKRLVRLQCHEWWGQWQR